MYFAAYEVRKINIEMTATVKAQLLPIKKIIKGRVEQAIGVRRPFL